MKITFAILLFFVVTISIGQNIVINPSFEDTIDCPYGSGQISKAVGWSSYSNSPEYYHNCCVHGCNVPNTPSGFQNAASGNAFSGLYTYHYLNTDFREYIGSQLLTPLLINQKYYVSYKVNLTNDAQCATNNLDILFSTVPYSQTVPLSIKNFAHVICPNIITDTLNWIIITNSFIADSAYKYIIFGNFFSDSITNTELFNVNDCVSYYFIDDICVSMDSLTCNSNSSIKENYLNNIFNIYPNPTNQNATLEFVNKNNSSYILTLYDSHGQLVRTITNITTNKVEIVKQNLANGLYYFQLSSEGKKYTSGKLTIK